MKPIWRMIDSGSLKCTEHIAIDKALLIAGKQPVPGSIRFFQAASEAVMLGCYQKAEREFG